MSILGSAAAVLLLPLAFLPGIAAADSTSINFESPLYHTGTINGQDGWTATGSAGSGCATYDEGVVANTYGYSSFGAQSFQISDAVTSGCFGDQAFAKPLLNAVGETDSTNGTFTAGTKQRDFTTQFDIASAFPTAQQTGLHLSVSPDRGDGSRMSYLRFEDNASGIDVFFDDVQGTTNPANFVETKIATGLNRAVAHNVKLTFQAKDGPSNDVVKVWIDGTLKITGTSWENYYRYDSEASAEQSPRIVKTVLFRAGGTAVPADAGKGFLIDNLSTQSATADSITKPKITSPAKNSALTSAQLTKIDWTDATDTLGSPISYQYQAFSDPGYSHLLYDSGPTLSASEIPTPGTPNGVYYVRVRALDTFGNQSAWSNSAARPYKITVRDLVAPPTLNSQCAGDGWKTFNNPAFKNREQCLDYVQKHSQKISGDVSYTANGLKREADFNMNTADNSGTFKYTDANHASYEVAVSSVSVSGNDGYFAGKVTKASDPSWVGQWLFAKVENGTPDLIWGSFTDMATANTGVTNKSTPADGPFTVTKGNIKIK